MKQIFALTVMLALLCGCDPDKLNVTMTSSEIDKARNGSIGYAKVKISYSFHDDDLKAKLPQLKKVVLPYTCDGEVDYEKDEFKTAFNVSGRIPIGDAVSVSRVKCPIAFVLSGDKLEFRTTSYLERLNGELEDINSQVKAEFAGCKMNVSIVKNTNAPLKLEAFGVFVDEKPYAHSEVDFEIGDQKTITFHRGDSSIYHDLNPFFNIATPKGAGSSEDKPSPIPRTGAASSGLCSGAILFVNALAEVDGDRDGSELKPYKSIQTAIDKAKSHQRIIVADGEYSESIQIKDKTISLRSKNGPAVTTIRSVKGKNGISVLSGAEGSEIRGFAITGGTGFKKVNGDGYIMCGGGVYCEVNASLSDCIVYQNGKGIPRETAATLGGAVFCGGGELLISNCLIFDNFAWAGGGGVHAEGGRVNIERSTIADNESTDFHGYIGGVGVSKYGKADIAWSIIWGNGGDQVGAMSRENSGTEVSLRYSNIEGGPEEGKIMEFDSGRGCFNKFPRFEDPISSNYELKSNSPCLNVETDDGSVEIGFSKKRIRN